MDDKHKEVLLRTMRDFIGFCDKAGLRWYLAFGSAIGAVRHKGMIPWDDDIDVYMPRPDYERLLEMKGKVASITGGCLEGEYDIVGLRAGDDDLPFPFTKFCDMNSTMWEQERYPYVYGVFIDIFPLDECSADIAQVERVHRQYSVAFKKYRRSLRRYTMGKWFGALKDLNFQYCISAILDICFYRLAKVSLRKTFVDLDKSLSMSSGPFRMTYSAYSSAEKVCFPREWVEGYDEVQFENMMVRLPSGNDMILRKIYGDYMQFPPKYERISTHGQYFVDFTRRLSIEEIQDIGTI